MVPEEGIIRYRRLNVNQVKDIIEEAMRQGLVIESFVVHYSTRVLFETLLGKTLPEKSIFTRAIKDMPEFSEKDCAIVALYDRDSKNDFPYTFYFIEIEKN